MSTREEMQMADRIQIRRDLATNWTTANPTLASGEWGYETDTGKLKIGTGSTTWTSLGYFAADVALSDLGLTATATELNYVDGVTSAIQTQLDAKAETLSDLGLTATSTELNYVDGVTSAIQTQLDAKAETLTDLGITDGTDGQVLTTDGSGTFTFATTASGGGGGGSFEATASGAISDGDPVAINSDGTVSVVEETTTLSETKSDPVTFSTGQAKDIKGTFDSNSNKVVVAYSDADNSGYVTVAVGTVANGDITFGTPVVAVSLNTNFFGIGFDSNENKVVLSYRNGSTSLDVLIGTVSGNSISFGSAITADSGGAMTYSDVVFDSNSNKIVVAYRDGSNSNYGTAVVGTVSGNSATFGTPVVFATSTVEWIRSTFDSNSNRVVFVYRDASSSDRGKAVVGSVDGTSITFGSNVEFSTGSTYKNSVTFDSNSNKIVVVYREGGSSNYGTTKIGTVDDTSITFGSAVTHHAASSTFNTVAFDSNTNKILTAFYHNSNGVKAIVGTVSGDSITYGTAFQIESGNVYEATSSVFDSNSNKTLVFYGDSGDTNDGKAVVIQAGDVTTTNLTAENYAGIADGAYADAATATIQTAGSIDDAQSGLTSGQAYFIQEDGTLAVTADTTRVFAGVAISTTKLLIGKDGGNGLDGNSVIDGGTV